MAAFILAPMEGLTDVHMRHVLTQISQYDWCVSEFLRVTDRLLPASSFLAHCPELLQGSRTANGTPVHLQLLGSEPEVMAENAARAAALGVAGIDINFGCPAKTVNRHRGGAALLAEASLMHDIVACVRRAVPEDTPVSAKIRLGISDASALQENASAIRSAGADWLTIHGRTREQGYRPPVDWAAIGRVKARHADWRIIANGDIASPESAAICREESGCDDLMLGRAAVCEPDLVARLRAPMIQALSWRSVQAWQLHFLQRMQGAEQGIVGRYKQWLGMTAQVYPEAAMLFQRVKKLRRIHEVLDVVAMSAGQQPVS